MSGTGTMVHAFHLYSVALEHHEMPTEEERADSWLSRVNVAQAARELIRKLCGVVGGAAIYSRQNPFDLALRDAETWYQHIAFQP